MSAARTLPDGATAAATVAARRPDGSFSRRLWEGAADVFARIVEHPFIVGLVDGSLDRRCFVQFLQQDHHYLEAYARSLNLLAVKSPRQDWAKMFARHAVEAIAAEEDLQGQLLAALGPDGSSAEGSGATGPGTTPSPTTFAYASHLIASCYDGSFLDGLATILPCYWIYAEVGDVLQAAGSTDPLYATWIASYAGPEYTAVVHSVLEVADETGASAGPADEERCRLLYRTGARLEWMFWDAAHRRETWPV